MTAAIIPMPGLASRAMRVQAAHESAIAEARQRQAHPVAHRFTSGSYWRDLKRGGVVIAHGVTVGIGDRAIWVTVSRPGAPLGQDAIRMPCELAPLYSDEVHA
ncbi:hypothetical protein [Elioraea sp.]|uniref:hypothetical protein n=1 Tax=Elioraea sp. TaxID=2185103 RepID=UPI0025BDEE7F|nr:hypothetical protein [Elioraea sp.]